MSELERLFLTSNFRIPRDNGDAYKRSSLLR